VPGLQFGGVPVVPVGHDVTAFGPGFAFRTSSQPGSLGLLRQALIEVICAGVKPVPCGLVVTVVVGLQFGGVPVEPAGQVAAPGFVFRTSSQPGSLGLLRQALIDVICAGVKPVPCGLVVTVVVGLQFGGVPVVPAGHAAVERGWQVKLSLKPLAMNPDEQMQWPC
jgi:uncharacterized Zn-binding protein involved in type VI secretion